VTTTYPPVDLDDVHRMDTALGKLLSTVRRRIPTTWTPTWRSDAEDEVKATSRLLRTDGSRWGESPLCTVFPVSGMLIDTVIQNTDATHVLLESRATSTVALDAQARAALEAAAQAWWLLEPGLGGRARVSRLYVLRRSSAGRLEHAAQKMGLQTASGYGALVQELDDLYQGEFGLTPMFSSKGNWIGCENQGGVRLHHPRQGVHGTDWTGPGNWTIRLLLRSVTRRTVAHPVLLRRNSAP
jgi:hypothetical protein